MIIQVLHFPYCQETDIVKHGLSSEGKQRLKRNRFKCYDPRGGKVLISVGL